MGIKDNLVTKSGMTYTFGDIKIRCKVLKPQEDFLKENPKNGKRVIETNYKKLDLWNKKNKNYELSFWFSSRLSEKR